MRECWPWEFESPYSYLGIYETRKQKIRDFCEPDEWDFGDYTIPELLAQADMVRMARRGKEDWRLFEWVYAQYDPKIPNIKLSLENPGVAGM
jgi:hypothetical protein